MISRLMLSMEDLVSAYRRTGGVRKAAAEVGISYGAARNRLLKCGALRRVQHVTASEIEAVRAAYTSAGDGLVNVAALAAKIGRPEIAVSRIARRLGLTRVSRKPSDEVRAAMGVRARAQIADNGHPRGFAGHTHSDAAKAIISDKSLRAWRTAKAFGIGLMSEEQQNRRSDTMALMRAAMPAERAYSRAKQGRRDDIGPQYFRSAWEANYARYLNWLLARGDIVSWEYEPKTFWFESIKRGIRSYKPDFWIVEKHQSYFVEVKGWMDPKSITKLKRMKKYYPDVIVRVVAQREYSEITRKLSRLIEGWEK